MSTEPQGPQVAQYALMLVKNSGAKEPGDIAQRALASLADAIFRIAGGSGDPRGVIDTVIELLELSKTQIPVKPT